MALQFVVVLWLYIRNFTIPQKGEFVELNAIQLGRLFEALRQELAFQWRARYIEVLPGGVLVLSFDVRK